jgi:hypothetical protein
LCDARYQPEADIRRQRGLTAQVTT